MAEPVPSGPWYDVYRQCISVMRDLRVAKPMTDDDNPWAQESVCVTVKFKYNDCDVVLEMNPMILSGVADPKQLIRERIQSLMEDVERSR